jgi:hypothetical protein
MASKNLPICPVLGGFKQDGGQNFAFSATIFFYTI